MPDIGGIVDERRARIHIFLIREARTDACALLHIHMVSGCDISPNVIRGHTYAELIVLDFFDTSDFHSFHLLLFLSFFYDRFYFTNYSLPLT